jgi:pilus assembly protein CpaB
LRARILTITLAAVLGVLGVVAVFGYVRQADTRAVNGVKAETVMVATAQIPAGTSLNKAQHDNLLSSEKVPAASLSTPAVQSVTTANGRLVVRGPVAQGQVLLQNMLGSTASTTASGSFAVPPGMIAVTVNICIGEAVGSYLTPGSDVAVFDTVAGNGSQVQRSCETQHQILNSGQIARGAAATMLVLPKAEVLAVGQSPTAQSTATGSSVTVSTDPASSSSADGQVLVTLAVNQADAERLILINEVGMPYLALLGPQATMTHAPPVNLFQP